MTHRLMNVKLAGKTEEWIRFNTSWGDLPHEDAEAKSAREKILAAPHRRMGRGYCVFVELTDEEAASLYRILDSIAGCGESMTTEERGSDAYTYHIIRRDAEQIRGAYRSNSVPL